MHLANHQMQQTSKKALLAYIQTNATNEGKGDEELGSEKEAEAVEGDDQSCLTCGQNSRKVPIYMRIAIFENSRKLPIYMRIAEKYPNYHGREVPIYI